MLAKQLNLSKRARNKFEAAFSPLKAEIGELEAAAESAATTATEQLQQLEAQLDAQQDVAAKASVLAS